MVQMLIGLSLCLSACMPPFATPGTPVLTPPTPAETITPNPTPTATPTPRPTATATSSPTAIFFSGAGDISICGQDGDDQTAALLQNIPGLIFTLGDNSNESGRMIEYERCFGPTWGQFLDRLRPSAGNHDYVTPGAPDYYAYFGAAAGEAGKGYYSYDLGDWHIIVLNSNCGDVACGRDSEQIRWLKEDLTAHPNRCSAAYWHHPLWTSYSTGGSRNMIPFWEVLYENGVDFVMNGDKHFYERFQTLNPQGTPDPLRGIRQFTVGTGGAYTMFFNTPDPFSEKQVTGEFGIIHFSLRPESYTWEFINTAGAVLDRGSAACH